MTHAISSQQWPVLQRIEWSSHPPPSKETVFRTDTPYEEIVIAATAILDSETQTCPTFSEPSTPDQEPLVAGTEESSLLLDNVLLDLYLKGVLEKPVMEELTTSPVPGTENLTQLLDNPLLNDFTDIDCLLDPAWTGSAVPLSSPFLSDPDSPNLDFFKEGLIPETSLTPSSLSPPNDCLSGKKRRVIEDESGINQQPSTKISRDLKYHERRQKNNLASKVSRAKRRDRSAALSMQEKSLEVENASLRVKVEEMTRECEKLRKMLVGRLAQ